jgi:hypothetical protein
MIMMCTHVYMHSVRTGSSCRLTTTLEVASVRPIPLQYKYF